MAKSLVVVYCGGRGSGKTLSMTVECVLSMIAGLKVWSNYPIRVKYRDVHGNINILQSTLIDMDDLIKIQSNDEIRNGKVALDEWNLFVNARRSGAVANLVFSGVVQLIRKRNLSFYISCQDFQTLDKNIRWQCDVTCECFDLSYRYPNLKEGEIISQFITDWSGILCGRILLQSHDFYQRARNSRTRLLKGIKFFDAYDSFNEFDVMDIMSTRYSIKRKEKVIGDIEDNGGFPRRLVDEYKEELLSIGVNKIKVNDLKSALTGMGLDSEELRGGLGKQLKSAGFIRRQNQTTGDYYEILGVKNGG